MKAEQVDNAIMAGYRASYADMPRIITPCEWSAGVHAMLAAMEKNASPIKAIIIRAVMGWVTDYRRRHGCA